MTHVFMRPTDRRLKQADHKFCNLDFRLHTCTGGETMANCLTRFGRVAPFVVPGGTAHTAESIHGAETERCMDEGPAS
jgi:hypothetical protein